MSLFMRALKTIVDSVWKRSSRNIVSVNCTTYNLSVTAVVQNGVLRKSNTLPVSTHKYSDEVATVKASPDNTSLIAGVVVLGVLFVTSGLFSLYLLCHIKRLAMIYTFYIFIVGFV